MSQFLRFSYVNAELLKRVMHTRSGNIRRELAILEGASDLDEYRRISFLVSDFEWMGLFKYALGSPGFSEIRDHFTQAVQFNIRLFRTRGTHEGIPHYDFYVDPSKPKGDPGRTRLERSNPPGTKDYSLTNSKDGYWHVCLALGIGRDDLAREMAALLYDPPEAGYVKPDSLVTPAQQALAYAMRQWLAGDVTGASDFLKKVRTLPDDPVGHQACMLKAIIERDKSAFLSHLGPVLDWNGQRSRREKNDPTYYICVPALGLAALAVSEGVLAAGDLPRNVYLPIELFEGAA